MPRKKPERVLPPGDDGFSKAMRERLKNLKLQEGDASEARSVSDTKADDLISVEAENAKISGLNAMWYMDRLTDQAIAEDENPDVAVLRKKYGNAMRKLDPVAPKEKKKEEPKAEKGFLEMTNVQDIDDLFESARQPVAQPRAAKPASPEAVGASDPAVAADAPAQDGEAEWKEGDVADYLEEIQKRSTAQDKVSRRVVKSREMRKEDYEESKSMIFAATGGLGVVGTGAALALYGVNSAFSFGLGSFGALMYLSGLSDYADNAESPVGTALGGRRLLVPVILVLATIQWYKIEALVPAIADLHLEPQLFPVILGFFMYVIGKVLGSAMSNAKQ